MLAVFFRNRIGFPQVHLIFIKLFNQGFFLRSHTEEGLWVLQIHKNICILKKEIVWT